MGVVSHALEILLKSGNKHRGLKYFLCFSFGFNYYYDISKNRQFLVADRQPVKGKLIIFFMDLSRKYGKIGDEIGGETKRKGISIFGEA